MAASSLALASSPRPVHYPDSDGMPMAENTKQFRWIVVLKENIDALVADFVAGDLLWYPIEGDNKTRQAPDVLVAFGRPKGDRGSYRQWEEDGVAPQVVFEVLSPGNPLGEMIRKFKFYERFGVEEYYIIDPEANSLLAYRRQDGQLLDVNTDEDVVSPRLGLRFHHADDELQVLRPDGQPFRTFQELVTAADTEKQRADTEKQRADAERQRADTEKQRADATEARLADLAARLRALGLEP